MKKIFNISGTCPESGHLETMEATYAVIRMIGNPSEHLKLTSYYCDYANEHGCATRQDDDMNCPLFRKAHSLGV